MLQISDLTADTREAFIAMCREFYASDAVVHSIPVSYMENTANDILNGEPFARALIFRSGTDIAGYALLSLTYSNEAGGRAVSIEEVFVKESHRGKGIGKAFFSWLFENYDDKVRRYRLEVSRENVRVCKLYRAMGFSELDYLQMISDRAGAL